MTPSLHILRPGLLTTVQDLGRAGYQSLGIAVGGALDPVGLRAANALVGNAPGTGALEVLYLGPTIAIEADDVRMAFAGASAAIEILADASAARGRRVETMRSIRLRRGEMVRIGSLSEGAVLYWRWRAASTSSPCSAVFRPISAAASAAGTAAH